MSYNDGRRLEGDRPYHSIDLESAPAPPLSNAPHHDEERMPLSPRASAVPQFQFPEGSNGDHKGTYPPRPTFSTNASHASTVPHQPGGGHKQAGSWDILGGFQKDWNGYDSRNASTAAFQYAEGMLQTSFSVSMRPLTSFGCVRGRAADHGQSSSRLFVTLRVSWTCCRLGKCISSCSTRPLSLDGLSSSSRSSRYVSSL